MLVKLIQFAKDLLSVSYPAIYLDKQAIDASALKILRTEFKLSVSCNQLVVLKSVHTVSCWTIHTKILHFTKHCAYTVTHVCQIGLIKVDKNFYCTRISRHIMLHEVRGLEICNSL